MILLSSLLFLRGHNFFELKKIIVSSTNNKNKKSIGGSLYDTYLKIILYKKNNRLFENLQK